MSTVTALPSRDSLVSAEINFIAWLAEAAPGDILEYHGGVLVMDRAGVGQPMSAEDRRDLVCLSNRAMQHDEQGLVHLVQRRIERAKFSYLAIASRKPERNPALLLSLNTETSDGAALS